MEEVILTESAIIGSRIGPELRQVTKDDLRKYFEETLGADYAKYAVVADVLKNSFYYKGRTLKEIVEECHNPSWYEKTDESVTSFHVQKETRARIEDVIPHYLEGAMKNAALDFVSYLQSNRIQLKWAGWNCWKTFYKSKILCWITIDLFVRPITWEVSPVLARIDEYEGFIVDEGWQDFILDNFKRCNPNCPGRCGGSEGVTILGKEALNICREVFYVNNKKVDYANPDEATINRIKKLLELERAARKGL